MVIGFMKSIQLGFVQHSPGTETQQNLTECCHRPSHPLCWKMAAKNVPVSLSVTSDFLFLSHCTRVKIQLSFHCFCSTNWDESILSFRDFECLICAFITATLDYRNALYVFICRASISRLQLPLMQLLDFKLNLQYIHKQKKKPLFIAAFIPHLELLVFFFSVFILKCDWVVMWGGGTVHGLLWLFTVCF